MNMLIEGEVTFKVRAIKYAFQTKGEKGIILVMVSTYRTSRDLAHSKFWKNHSRIHSPFAELTFQRAQLISSGIRQRILTSEP